MLTIILIPERWGHPHTSNDSLQWLKQRLGDRMISRRCETEQATHSPDLNPLLFFYLWDYLKDNVYENNPQTIPKLQRVITAKKRTVPVEVHVLHVVYRWICSVAGAHLEHIMERCKTKTVQSPDMKRGGQVVHGYVNVLQIRCCYPREREMKIQNQ